MGEEKGIFQLERAHRVIVTDNEFVGRFSPSRPNQALQQTGPLVRAFSGFTVTPSREMITWIILRGPGWMPLPEFNEFGDLPEGKYPASLAEVIARFGSGTAQRTAVTARLQRICRLAIAAGHLDRLVVFGSYVSDVSEPNDVDVILVMRNEFRPEDCPAEAAALFDHARANDELGASVFWVRPDMLLDEPLEQFLAFWQTKRDGRRRGVVEIQP
jgi:hypothetical protein